MIGYFEGTQSCIDATIYRSGPPQLAHSATGREKSVWLEKLFAYRNKDIRLTKGNFRLTPVITANHCSYSLDQKEVKPFWLRSHRLWHLVHLSTFYEKWQATFWVWLRNKCIFKCYNKCSLIQVTFHFHWCIFRWSHNFSLRIFTNKSFTCTKLHQYHIWFI